jgi:hypothetical protein
MVRKISRQQSAGALTHLFSYRVHLTPVASRNPNGHLDQSSSLPACLKMRLTNLARLWQSIGLRHLARAVW